MLITTPLGCAEEYSILISEQCPGSIYVPNSFSPNGDGINDFWLVKGENVANFNLKLYNRWGELFWENNDIDRPWLGQHRSDGQYYLEPGVYVYLITFTLLDEEGAISDELQYKGNVTLIR